MSASILSVILGFLRKIGITAIAAWFIKRAGKKEAYAEIEKKNLEKRKEYEKIAGEHRSSDDVNDRMRDGTF